MPCWFRFTVKQPCSRRGYGYVYGYESFPGLPGAPLAACTQAATPLQAQTWGVTGKTRQRGWTTTVGILVALANPAPATCYFCTDHTTPYPPSQK